MKKITAILFLFIFLFASKEAGELLKLPVLIHHYLEHHDDDDAGISFISYLHKHYDETSSHASHNNEHEKLPFKSHDVGFAQTQSFFNTPLVLEFEVCKLIPAKQNTSFKQVFCSSSILSRIWQPPKFC